MLGLDNPIHILFLLVILLLVFGAKRLPETGRSLGEGLRGFKDSLTGGHHDLPAAAPVIPPAVAAAPPARAHAAAHTHAQAAQHAHDPGAPRAR